MSGTRTFGCSLFCGQVGPGEGAGEVRILSSVCWKSSLETRRAPSTTFGRTAK
ncbi:MAG: hypothetical protein U0R24_15725 [Solirubrobacterales bacterium]